MPRSHFVRGMGEAGGIRCAETPCSLFCANKLKLTGPAAGVGNGTCGACPCCWMQGNSCLRDGGFRSRGQEGHDIEGLPRSRMRRGLHPADAPNALHPVKQAGMTSRCHSAGMPERMMMSRWHCWQEPESNRSADKDAFTNKPTSPHLCRCGPTPPSSMQ